MRWEYVITGIEGNCQLFDINIFDYEWENTGNRIKVKDPAYGQEHIMTVYMVKINEKVYTFAAGEFSNMIWGFYLSV
jgi:hypothetical protein